jgi:hypothetical protein
MNYWNSFLYKLNNKDEQNIQNFSRAISREWFRMILKIPSGSRWLCCPESIVFSTIYIQVDNFGFQKQENFTGTRRNDAKKLPRIVDKLQKSMEL